MIPKASQLREILDAAGMPASDREELVRATAGERSRLRTKAAEDAMWRYAYRHVACTRSGCIHTDEQRVAVALLASLQANGHGGHCGMGMATGDKRRVDIPPLAEAGVRPMDGEVTSIRDAVLEDLDAQVPDRDPGASRLYVHEIAREGDALTVAVCYAVPRRADSPALYGAEDFNVVVKLNGVKEWAPFIRAWLRAEVLRALKIDGDGKYWLTDHGDQCAAMLRQLDAATRADDGTGASADAA
jgi:hypothetical protein